ncbi:MAG: PACE efflux transporter [Marinagarivorans sp.]|nr:PACE efflux transporter [Marinagarivorans sp.]
MKAEHTIPLRSLRERAIQTLTYEFGAIALVTPLYQWIFGTSTGESLQLLVSLSAAAILWLPVHNTLFDRYDALWFGRVASDRRGLARCVHAFSYEISTLVVTVPMIMWIGGHAFLEALLLDLGFTLFNTTYAWAFHWCFDRWFPVKPVSQTAPSRRPRLPQDPTGTVPACGSRPPRQARP